MEALCVICRQPVEARYVIGDSGVQLHRRCSIHGGTHTAVATDAGLFDRGLALTRVGLRRHPYGLIVELLDGCNVRCPTCIAGSAPGSGRLRDPKRVASYLSQISSDHDLRAVLLSGGEPTIHPELQKFIGAVEDLGVPGRVLITNGLRIATESTFASDLASWMSYPWEVFLQFDSRRAAVLRNLRGTDLTLDHRRRALERLQQHRIATTLVCVVKRGLNLDEVGDLVEFAKTEPHVTGIQFQPIREAGRLENFEKSQACDLGAVRRELLASGAVPELVPHPTSPLSLAVARFDRNSETWLAGTRADDFFIDESRVPDGRLRVSVLEYSDPGNWSSQRSETAPLRVLTSSGTVVTADSHFSGVDYGPAPGVASATSPTVARAAAVSSSNG